jgi:hypothetical protein
VRLGAGLEEEEEEEEVDEEGRESRIRSRESQQEYSSIYLTSHKRTHSLTLLHGHWHLRLCFPHPRFGAANATSTSTHLFKGWTVVCTLATDQHYIDPGVNSHTSKYGDRNPIHTRRGIGTTHVSRGRCATIGEHLPIRLGATCSPYSSSRSPGNRNTRFVKLLLFQKVDCTVTSLAHQPDLYPKAPCI